MMTLETYDLFPFFGAIKGNQSNFQAFSLLYYLVLFYNIVSETFSYYKIISIFMSKLLKSTKEEIPM